MSRILVAYASTFGQTRKIANTLAAELRQRGHEVELADALQAMPPPVEDYDAVVIGSRVHLGLHARPLVEYIIDNRNELHAMPSYLFAVSMAAAGHHDPDPRGYVARLLAMTHWQPRAAIALGGALPSQYGAVVRTVMALIHRLSGNATDASRDDEYTDWSRVRQLAAAIARDLAPRRAPQPRAPIAQA